MYIGGLTDNFCKTGYVLVLRGTWISLITY